MPVGHVPTLARDAPCPHCGATVRAEPSELGTFFLCASCDLEWVENLALDFQSD